MEYERSPEYRVEKVETHTSLARVVNEARADGYVEEETIVVGAGEVWVTFVYAPWNSRRLLMQGYFNVQDGLRAGPSLENVLEWKKGIDEQFELWFATRKVSSE